MIFMRCERGPGSSASQLAPIVKPPPHPIPLSQPPRSSPWAICKWQHLRKWHNLYLCITVEKKKKSAAKVKVAGFVNVCMEKKCFSLLGREGERKKKSIQANGPGVAIQMMTSLKFDLPLEVNYEARSGLCWNVTSVFSPLFFFFDSLSRSSSTSLKAFFLEKKRMRKRERKKTNSALVYSAARHLT